jgi:hypothetical protein
MSSNRINGISFFNHVEDFGFDVGICYLTIFHYSSRFLNLMVPQLALMEDAAHLQECKRRGLKVTVAGIPKTIDNDIDVSF